MGIAQSLASVIGVSDTANPVTCGISEFDPTTYSEKGKIEAFQYFPETITDSKSSDWVRKNVPGGSHPILSFINGGERTISFTAVFTQEENPEEVSLVSSLLTGKFELFKDNNRKDTEKNIAGAIAFLRSFTYPDYIGGISKAPPFAIIYLPNSGITGNGSFKDSIVGAMVQCDVTYQKFHRNGAPRYVEIQLSFVEVIQTSANWKFVGRGDIYPSAGNNTTLSGEALEGDLKPYHRTMIGAEKSNGSLGLGGVLGAAALVGGAAAALRRR